MIQYHYRDEVDEENCQAFEGIVFDHPDIHFFQPSPIKAPWHVQAILPGAEPIVLNFWPHKMKGQRQPFPAIEGVAKVRSIIAQAIQDAKEEPFDVIEAAE
jgi:hypothetical protein